MQGRDLVRRRQVLQLQRDERIARVHAADQIGQQLRQDRRHERNAQHANLPARGKPRGLLRAHRLMKRGARFGQKEPPGVAQRDVVPVTLEEPHLQFLFQCLDLHAQRGLHDT